MTFVTSLANKEAGDRNAKRVLALEKRTADREITKEQTATFRRVLGTPPERSSQICIRETSSETKAFANQVLKLFKDADVRVSEYVIHNNMGPGDHQITIATPDGLRDDGERLAEAFRAMGYDATASQFLQEDQMFGVVIGPK
ncbi:MAG: hypothetical protein EON58_15220 [Alphaproteobacteria bacterium]|nr:MAG: hypothetical protein EON58_15220 [Alphaproteobacteria bacterium]